MFESGTAGVPQRLRQIMSERDWTIAQMAETCDVSRSAMEKYLKGVQSPGMEAILSICDGCGVSPNWLLLGLKDPIQHVEMVSREEIAPIDVAEIAGSQSALILSDIANHLECSKSLEEVRAFAKLLRERWPHTFAFKISLEYSEYYKGRRRTVAQRHREERLKG